MLDKTTGKLQGEKGGSFGSYFSSNWSSAAFGKNGDQDCIVFGAGMAVLRVRHEDYESSDGNELFKSSGATTRSPKNYG